MYSLNTKQQCYDCILWTFLYADNEITLVNGLESDKLCRLHTLELRGNRLTSISGLRLPSLKNLYLVCSLYCLIKVCIFYSALLKGSGTATSCQGISQIYLHTHAFNRGRNELYLSLPSQPKLVLIYRPRRDGRLSWPGQPERWVNSRPRTAMQYLSRLLTGQSITPHWASRCMQPAQSCCPEW